MKILSSLICWAVLGGAAQAASPAMDAYVRQDYAAGAALAAKGTEPESRLILALCKLYDRTSPDIDGARRGLEALWSDNTVPAHLRGEAGLALARTAQLMKARPDLYGKAGTGTDYRKLYGDVMTLVPGTATHRDAFFYLIREELENEATRDEAFRSLEAFFTQFSGDRKLLAPVHLLAEYEYIRLRKSYTDAVRHLEAGYTIGFANPGEERSALFRLGFLSWRNLKDREAAKRYFKLYLERYELSAQAAAARRFLREIGE